MKTKTMKVRKKQVTKETLPTSPVKKSLVKKQKKNEKSDFNEQELSEEGSNVDFYSSIFPEASSEEDDKFDKKKKIKSPIKKSKKKPKNSTTYKILTLSPKSRKSTPMMVDSESDSDEETNDFEFKNDSEEDSEPELLGVAINAHRRKMTLEQEDIELKQEVDSVEDEESHLSDNNEDNDEEEEEEDDETQSKRTLIRKELATLTYEELEGLKQKMGTKLYNEAMFGKGSVNPVKKSKTKRPIFKRDNKNRPRELPARVHVPKTREIVHVKKVARRDPRFDESCGELDKNIWEQNYDFIKELQQEEAKELRKSLKTEVNEERKMEVKQYLQNLKNKETSDSVKAKEIQKRKKEKEENIQRLKEGKNPFYMKKSTRKFLDLAEKYEELKSSGGLEKYLKKKRKKNLVRDKKSIKIAPKP